MDNWVAIASALIAAVGLFFTGGQLLVMNRAAAMQRRIAREGVVVSWRPVEAPRQAEADGTAVWDYEIRVDNPGALPVDNIRVDWQFQLPVQRRRLGHFDAPTTRLELIHPVLAGGGYRVWGRKLVMDFEEAQKALPGTYADIHFVDIEGHRHANRWPRNIASR